MKQIQTNQKVLDKQKESIQKCTEITKMLLIEKVFFLGWNSVFLTFSIEITILKMLYLYLEQVFSVDYKYLIRRNNSKCLSVSSIRSSRKFNLNKMNDQTK